MHTCAHMRRIALAVAISVAVSGCAGGLSRNNTSGLAVVGGAAAIAGVMVGVDGLTCEESNWARGSCTHDNRELATGGALFVGGGALLTWAILQLAGSDDEAAPAPSTRTAKKQ